MGFTLFHLGRAPVRLHWSVLLGLFVFSSFRFDPVGWLGVLGLILAHEAGHALVVKWPGARATAIELTGFGGLCRWEGEVSPLGRAAIAWGGVWAQLVVLAVAWAVQSFGGPVTSPVAWRLLAIGTVSNAWMIALNLLPIPPLDGAEAWRLPLLLGRAARLTLSGHRDVRHVPGGAAPDELPPDTPHAEAAKHLASRLLDEARRPEEPR